MLDHGLSPVEVSIAAAAVPPTRHVALLAGTTGPQTWRFRRKNVAMWGKMYMVNNG